MISLSEISGASVLRVGMSIVFLWIGAEQFLHPKAWIEYVPQSIIDLSSLGTMTILHLNGAFELVLGTALLFGLFTRISALLLAGHLAGITYVIGYTSVGAYDFAMMVATFAIFFNGADNLTLDHYFLLPQEESGESSSETHFPVYPHPPVVVQNTLNHAIPVPEKPRIPTAQEIPSVYQPPVPLVPRPETVPQDATPPIPTPPVPQKPSVPVVPLASGPEEIVQNLIDHVLEYF